MKIDLFHEDHHSVHSASLGRRSSCHLVAFVHGLVAAIWSQLVSKQE